MHINRNVSIRVFWEWASQQENESYIGLPNYLKSRPPLIKIWLLIFHEKMID